MRRTALLLLVLPLLAACQSGRAGPQATGVVQPTVAGIYPTEYANLQEGRMAFTRVGGSLTAVLEDAAWLKFEGDPACVERNHRAYFEYGYTTFQIELRSREFTQPTCEEFLLEDDLGARIPGRPLSFEGSPVLVDDRYFSRFSLSFQHALSRRTGWIRLTRVADGSSLEWQFGPVEACPPEPCPPPSRAPSPCAPQPCAPQSTPCAPTGRSPMFQPVAPISPYPRTSFAPPPSGP